MDELTSLTGEQIHLKAENLRLKMLLRYVIDIADGCHNHEFGGPLDAQFEQMPEARRYANGDGTELREIIAKAVLDAVVAERKRCSTDSQTL